METKISFPNEYKRRCKRIACDIVKNRLVARLKVIKKDDHIERLINAFEIVLTGIIENNLIAERLQDRSFTDFKEFHQRDPEDSDETDLLKKEDKRPLFTDDEYFVMTGFCAMLSSVPLGSEDQAFNFAFYLGLLNYFRSCEINIVDIVSTFLQEHEFSAVQEKKFYSFVNRKPNGFSRLKHEAEVMYHLIEQQCSFVFIICQQKAFVKFDTDIELSYDSATNLFAYLKTYNIVSERAGLWLSTYHKYINKQKDVNNIKNEIVSELSKIIDSVASSMPPKELGKKISLISEVLAMIHSVTCRLQYHKYISNIDGAITGFKIKDMRRYTVYNDFEACVDYDPTYSLVEEDGMNKYDQSPPWRDLYKDPLGNNRSCERFDFRQKQNKRFDKYKRKEYPLPSPEEDLIVYTYDADYSNFTRGGSKKLYVNLHAVTQDKNNITVRVEGFRPYVYVAVPDNWIEDVENKYEDAESRKRCLVAMIRNLRNILDDVLKKKFWHDFRFKNERFLIYPLPDDDDKVIEEVKDLMGYTGDLKTKAFKLELLNPQLVPTLRKMLWFPYGGKTPKGDDVKPWANYYESIIPPMGSTIFERNDRLWLTDKEKEFKKLGIPFNKEDFRDDPNRKLFNDAWYPGVFGDTPMFSVYECNVDFIVRFIADRQLQMGWIGLKGGKWQSASSYERMYYTSSEVFVHVDDIIKYKDPEESIKRDPKTDKLERELTEEEKKIQTIIKTPPPFTIACFDAEMLMRFPAFPTPRFCPIIQWGWNFHDAQTNKGKAFEFVLGKPEFVNDEEEKKSKDPDIQMWTLSRKEEDDTETTVFYYYNETDMLRDMAYFEHVMQPQILESWNGNGFDIPYYTRRCQVLGIVEGRSFLQRCRTRDIEWSTTYVKKRRVVDVTTPGLFLNDLMYYMMNFKSGWRSFSLNNASNIILKESKYAFGYDQIEPSHFTYEGREMIRRYLYGDITLPRKIADKDGIYPQLISYTAIQSVPFAYLITRGAQIKVYAGILSYKKKKWEVKWMCVCVLPTYPRKGEKKKTYAGAIVMKPLEGYYTVAVATLDFASLYPSIMMRRNTCYTTMITEWAKRKLGIKQEDYWTQEIPVITDKTIELEPDKMNPEWVKKEVHEGMLPCFERDLKAWRGEAKKVMGRAETRIKTLSTEIEKGICPLVKDDMSQEEQIDLFRKWKTELEYNIRKAQDEKVNADAYQNAIKVYMNSIYGFLGAVNSLCGLKAAAACITREGQIAVTKAKQFAEANVTIELGFPGDLCVIYGDTDSIMFCLKNKDGTFATYTPIQMMHIGAYLSKRISTEVFSWGLVLEFEKIYIAMILLSKKHYIAIKFDDTCIYTLDIKGVQTKRSDSFNFLDKIFNKCVIRVLKYNDVDFMVDYVARQFILLASGKVSLIDLAKGCSLRRDLAVAYTPEEGKRLAITAGMIIAKKRKERTGEDAYAGDRYKFVVVRRKISKGMSQNFRVKKTEESVREASEEVSYAIKKKMNYDAAHYIEKLYDNLVIAFKYCVPGGEPYLKKRWLEQPEMKTVYKKVDGDSALFKAGVQREYKHCAICNTIVTEMQPLPNESEQFGIVRETLNNSTKTRQHIVLEYEGIGKSFIKECNVDIKYKICNNCKESPSARDFITKSYQQSITNAARTWDICQKCPTKNLAPEAIKNCTEYECDNLAKRIDAMSALNENFEKLRALRW